MSSSGNPYDNAKGESFMRTLKYEEAYMNDYEVILAVLSIKRCMKMTRPWVITQQSDPTQPQFQATVYQPWNSVFGHGEV
jgi:transposase InsO family protein